MYFLNNSVLFDILRIWLSVEKANPRFFFRILNNYRVFIKYCVFSKILKNIPDSVSACVHWTSRLDHQMVGRTPALQQNWQSLEKSQLLKEKTQYLKIPSQKSGSWPHLLGGGALFYVAPKLTIKRRNQQNIHADVSIFLQYSVRVTFFHLFSIFIF